MSAQQADTDGAAKAVGLYVLRSVNTIFTLVAAVGVLWVKANVPSKEDFVTFKEQVRSLEMSVVQLRQTNDRINDFEVRIRELERRGRITR